MYTDRISVDPAICSGKPCIKGTRIMVKNILGLFASGCTAPQILQEYPGLIEADIQAALEYAIELTDEVRLFNV